MIKKYSLSLFLAFVSLFVFAQHHQCNHKVGFEKSSLSDTLDVISYHIYVDSINWGTDHLYARTQIQLESKVDNLNYIGLELMDFTVDEVLVNGVQKTFSHEGYHLKINLDEDIQAGDQREVWVSYHGVPFSEGWGGFYIDNQYAYNLGVGFDSDPHNLGKSWFPCVDDFHDRAIYDVTARVEDPKTAVAGGLLQEVIDHGDGTKSYHWHLMETIPTYLASLAIGEYELYEDVYEGETADIPIKIYVRPYAIDHVEPSFVHLKEILATFETHFGSYPFERVGYVATTLGAMEHATNIAYPSFAIDGYLGYEDLYAHELSHMWFGDKVTCASAEDMWLNEGWATYSSIFYREDIYGEESYKEEMMHKLREVLRTTHYTDGGYLALYGISHAYTYGSTVYDKGSTVVQSLRAYLTDEVFFPAIKAYLENYAYNYASSENLRDFLSDYTGVDMTDFFDAYVFTPGFSHFNVDSLRSIGGGQYEIYMRQKLKGKEVFANSNKVDVTVMDENWEQHDLRIEFDGETASSIVDLPFEPVAIMTDLHRTFSDATSDEAKVIKEVGEENYTECYFKLETEAVSDSAFVRVTHHWVAPDALKTPQEGLILSDYRYYSIEGIIPDGFQATGVFRYTMSGKLDHTLLGNPLDSLVMLYRPNAAADWQTITYEQDGSPFVGYMRVPNIKVGEYTLAIWQEQFVNVETPLNLLKKDYMHSYPNPSNGRVYFDLLMEENGNLEIYDMSGKLVDLVRVDSKQTETKWDGRRMPKGQYVVKLVNEKGEELAKQKVILQ